MITTLASLAVIAYVSWRFCREIPEWWKSLKRDVRQVHEAKQYWCLYKRRYETAEQHDQHA